MIIDFGKWEPDLPNVRAPHLRVASGVLPLVDGYEPFPSLSVTSNALTSACLGATTARDIDQAVHMYAGTSTTLEELEGFTWTDRSRVGGYGPAGDSTRWRFTTFGDRLLATNGLDEVQYIDMSTAASAFADLAGSPPSAELIASFGEFIVLGRLGTNGNAIKWSGFGNSEQWTPGSEQSDEQEFADGGRLTGFGALDVLYIFQERAIRRMSYVGGLEIMQIDKLVDGIGCVEPNSLVQWGTLFFFLSEDGYYMFDGQQCYPIGAGMFDRWFLENSQRAYWTKMSSAINPQRKTVCWGFASTSSGGSIDTILIYNWVAKKGSYVPYNLEFLLGASSLGISIDDLTTTDIDTMTISFDDPFFLGGTSYFAGINLDHKLGSFAGDSVEATLESGYFPLGNGGRSSIEWVRPITDATTATIACAATQKPEMTPTFGQAVSQQVSGRCMIRGANGNFSRIKKVIPASADWSYAKGFEFKAKAAGAR